MLNVSIAKEIVYYPVQVSRSVAFLFNKGATVISCVIKLYLGDIHRPRMSAAHDGLSKAQGCLWYSLANWEDKMLGLNRSCGPRDNG